MGGYGGQNPLIGPIFFFNIFTKTLPKQHSDAYPPRFCTLKTLCFGNFWPQNPFLRPVLATPLFASGGTEQPPDPLLQDLCPHKPCPTTVCSETTPTPYYKSQDHAYARLVIQVQLLAHVRSLAAITSGPRLKKGSGYGPVCEHT